MNIFIYDSVHYIQYDRSLSTLKLLLPFFCKVQGTKLRDISVCSLVTRCNYDAVQDKRNKKTVFDKQQIFMFFGTHI